MNVENLDRFLFEHCFTLYFNSFLSPFVSSSSSSHFIFFFFFFLNQNHLHKTFLNNPLSSISLPNPVIKKTHINKEIVIRTCIFNQPIKQSIQ